MKKLILIAALTAGFSVTANANEFSDFLDAQYDIGWAEETQFEVVAGAAIADQLAGYQTEGDHDDSDYGATVKGPVVDIAVMEIVPKPSIDEDDELFIETGE